MNFSEDVVPLSDLKVNPRSVIKHAAQAHRRVLLTSRGRAAVADLADIEAWRVVGLAEARTRLGPD
jgi:prevent-host-death family protein